MGIRLLAVLLMLAAMPAVAHAMDAQSFYVKGLALQKKGTAAILSPEIRPLMSEMRSAGKAVKAENDRAKAAGNPLFCIPDNHGMDANKMLAEFGKIPSNRRSKMSVTQALREILIRRYPC
ncbi:hypothetical protein ACFOWX_13450 [Sphingorhabdus arenilitoris]|uniref:Rap1a immunity protein domain-containing protein n=1 Tax=Sphingorhabdus arenilitoris TaxID=1490041 RepID=A0ABV8RK35_9SPHN